MEATVIKIGAIEMDFEQNGDATLRKKSKVREGWSSAFALYALEGEDKLMLPDFLDSETDDLDSYNLLGMLDEITENNIHHSIDTGMPIGNEI